MWQGEFIWQGDCCCGGDLGEENEVGFAGLENARLILN